MVFAHARGGARRGPVEALDLCQGEIAFPYRLANEGSGIALRIHHGVEVGGQRHAFGRGMETRVLRAGESVPPLSEDDDLLHRPLDVVVRESALPKGWIATPTRYWVTFENVFGERFETVNSIDPFESVSFEKLG